MRNYFSLEGGVAAGKTTLLKCVEERGLIPNLVILFEPLDLWQNAGGYNLLQRFYEAEDKGGVTFLLQSYVTLTMVERHLQARRLLQAGKIVLLERSISSTLVFLEENKSWMSDVEYAPLKDAVTRLSNSAERDLSKIYLCPSNREVVTRARNRARQSEGAVTDEYLCAMNEDFRREGERTRSLILDRGSPQKLATELLDHILLHYQAVA